MTKRMTPEEFKRMLEEEKRAKQATAADFAKMQDVSAQAQAERRAQEMGQKSKDTHMRIFNAYIAKARESAHPKLPLWEKVGAALAKKPLDWWARHYNADNKALSNEVAREILDAEAKR